MKLTDEELIELSEAVSDWLTKKFGEVEVHFALVAAGESTMDGRDLVTVVASNTESKDLIEKLLEIALAAVREQKPHLTKTIKVAMDA